MLQASNLGLDLRNLELIRLDDRSAGLDLHLRSIMAMARLSLSRMLDTVTRAMDVIKTVTRSLQQSKSEADLVEAEFSVNFRVCTTLYGCTHCKTKQIAASSQSCWTAVFELPAYMHGPLADPQPVFIILLRACVTVATMMH